MTHPTREDWMSFLYNELPAEEHARLQLHLQSCAECRAQMAVWQSAAGEMNGWKLAPRRKAPPAGVFVRWAAAAAIAGLAVVASGRILALSKEVNDLRAEIPRSSVWASEAALAEASERITKNASAETQALVAALGQQWEQKRLADQQALFAALQKLNARQATDYATLRKELETVAVFSEAGWQRTQNQISSLATTPTSFSDNN